MKLGADQQKVLAFIGVLSLCALVIGWIFFRQGQTRLERHRIEEADAKAAQKATNDAAMAAAARAEAARKVQEQAAADKKLREDDARKATENATAEHVRFLERYWKGGYTPKSGFESIAVAVASENQTPNQAIAKALAVHLQTNAVELLPAFLKPEFVSDGLVNEGFAGSSDLPSKLELTNVLSALLLGRQKVESSTNPDFPGMFTATMHLEVTLIPIGQNASSGGWTFNSTGAGFSQAEARAIAEEHLIKVIAEDTKMSIH